MKQVEQGDVGHQGSIKASHPVPTNNMIIQAKNKPPHKQTDANHTRKKMHRTGYKTPEQDKNTTAHHQNKIVKLDKCVLTELRL